MKNFKMIDVKRYLSGLNRLKRNDIVPLYVDLIKGNASEEEVVFVNKKILSKWSNSGLLYIKDKAWKEVINGKM